MNDDSITHIFSYLPLTDLLECRGVCKSWFNHVKFQISKRTKLRFYHIVFKNIQQKTEHVVKSLSNVSKCTLSSDKFYKMFKMGGVLNFIIPKNNFFSINQTLFFTSDDTDLHSDCIISLRWYTDFLYHEIQHEQLLRAQSHVTIPLLQEDNKNKNYSGRLFNTWWSNPPLSLTGIKQNGLYPPTETKQIKSVSTNKHKPVVEKQVSYDLRPIVIGDLLSLYQIGSCIAGIWNDSKLTAFVVLSVFLDVEFIRKLLPLATSHRIPKPYPFDHFGISALISLRNFKKVYIREYYTGLYLSDESGSRSLQGIDKSSLGCISLDENYGMLWKTANFKGRVPGCLIFDVVLFRNPGNSTKNTVFDLSQYRLSKLVKSREIDVTHPMFNSMEPGKQISLLAESDTLVAEVVLCFKEERDCYSMQDIEIYLKL